MNRKDNKVEMDIIKDMMDRYNIGSEPIWLKKIYTDQPPEKTLGVEKIMDGLILLIHERNWLVKTRRGKKKWDEEDIRKMEFLNGEINAICYCLGRDTRL
jgi:hypothetical protein